MKFDTRKYALPALLLASSPLVLLTACDSHPVKMVDETQPQMEQVQPVNDQPVTIPEEMFYADGAVAANDTGATPVETEQQQLVESSSVESPLTESSGSNQSLAEAIPEPESDTVNFRFGSSKIDFSYDAMLKQHAHYLSDNPRLTLIIRGHTDSQGPKSFNQLLSQRRADEVAQRLVDYGAPVVRIRTNGVADDEPLETASNKDQRRVELLYQDSQFVNN